MADITTRLDIPYPELADDADIPADLLAALLVLDDAAMWDEGAYSSRPLTAAAPKGLIWRQTDTGGGYGAGTLSINTSSGWAPVSLTADQLAAIAGSAGTPGAANPFLTEDDTEVMHRDKVRTVTAQHTYALPTAGTATTYGSGGSYTIADAYTPIIYGTATGITFTLPQVTNTGGGPMVIINSSTGIMTVNRGGTDIIDDALTTMTVPAKSVAVLQPMLGTGSWKVLSWGGETALTTHRTQTITGNKTFSSGPRHGVQAFTASGSISSTDGKLVTFIGAASQTLTLPAAAVGLEYEIMNIDTTDNVTIARAGSDTIDGATSVVLGPGERLTVRCTAAATWITSQLEARNSDRQRIIRVAPIRGIQAFVASGTISATGAEDVTFIGSASQTLTLPTASPGMSFTIRNLDTADAVSLARAGSDTINNALTSISIAQGMIVDVFCDQSGHWTATERQVSVVAEMHLANSGSPTQNNIGNWQKVGSGGGTATWVAGIDLRPNGVSAQVDIATNKRIDIKVNGRYEVEHSAYFSSIGSDKTTGSAVALNGTRTEATHIGKSSDGGVSDTPVHGQPALDLILDTTHYLELQAYQNSAASASYITAAPTGTRLRAKRIGPNW